ncbi:MAG: thiamine-phosphate kinase [Lacipirellulaceae bacterium]
MRNLATSERIALEIEFTQWLADNVPACDEQFLGIGDDAAILRGMATEGLVVTTDTLTDGIDFLTEKVPPNAIGHKALGVNLSDLAAMAAKPRAAVVSLVLPKEGAAGLPVLDFAITIYEGLIPLALQFETSLVGGDTNTWDGPLVIGVTAIGEVTEQGPLTRSGAQLGDVLLITGTLGGSILKKHLLVEPRCREALQLNERYELHAGIDISDGLSLDASRLAQASGCGVALDLSAIPIAEDAVRRSARSGRDAIEHALNDGEDFELLLAVPPDAAEQILAEKALGIPVTRIGHCVSEAGLWQMQKDELKPLKPGGYLH